MKPTNRDSEPARNPAKPTAPADGRFSLSYIDPSADPVRAFYDYATGGWRKANPIPADKADWNAFRELSERNAGRLRTIAEDAAAAPDGAASRLVGAYFQAATDEVRRAQLGLAPVRPLLDRIARIASVAEIWPVVADLHQEEVPVLFDWAAEPDRRASRVYAFYLWQGGLTLPDRDYYRLPTFASVREQYRGHIGRLLALAGDPPEAAARSADIVLDLETAIARASRTRAELRDVLANYHRIESADLPATIPHLPWERYRFARGIPEVDYVILGQPEFQEALGTLLAQRPLEEWRTYLRWHALHAAAPHLSPEAEREDFAFFQRTLQGQAEMEPPWRRALRLIDQHLGEALGRRCVEAQFPAAGRTRMLRLVEDLREVFAERLRSLEWMTEETRGRALEKFRRFEARIGHPDTFRDYAGLAIRPDDHFGNVLRALRFESRRKLERLGGPVDRAEWLMTAPTVNAYFHPSLNEIFFPAGILQPPFFDPDADDAVNYGAIGVVIGHEITHGYDDQGRRFDADGNLNDWWTAADAEEFRHRAEAVVAQYSAIEPLPGVHINGELTLGENIADFGGVRLAFEALQRRLARDPEARKTIDGRSPEERFFLSYAQIWRQNCREEELRRRLTIDPHSPGRYRVEVPLANLAEFRAAFARGAPSGSPSAGPSVTIW